MKTKLIRASCLVAISTVLLAIGASPALAQQDANRGAQFKGTVTGVTGSSLQVQTQTGTLTFAIDSHTHVTRIVAGSLADVTSGKRVDLQLAKGTTSVVGITINTDAKPSHPSGSPSHPRTGKPKGHAPGNKTKGKGKPPGQVNRQGLHRSGVVVSSSSSKITLREGHGKTTTYSIKSSVKVTKIMSGQLSDLHLGESVQVFRASTGNRASNVTILNA